MRVRAPGEPLDVSWWGAVGNGSTDDSGAINGALQTGGIGLEFRLGPKLYACAQTISMHRDGQLLVGVQAGGVFSTSPTTVQGSVLKWTGASAGKLLFFGRASGATIDRSGGGIHGVQFSGASSADTVLHLRSCVQASFRDLKVGQPRDNSAAVALLLDSDVQASDGVNCIAGCVFDNISVNAGTGAGRGAVITGASDETSGKHPFGCVFNRIEITHDDGDGLYIDSADTLHFTGVICSKVSGGTGRGVYLNGNSSNGGLYVVGCTFSQLDVGNSDTPTFLADGAGVKGCAIYGLAAIDAAPTITLSNSAQVYYRYLGTPYDSDAAVRAALTYTPPLKIARYAHSGTDVLDWYEEGTITPTMTFGGGSTGMTTSTASGKFTRIGNMVAFRLSIVLTAKGSSTGSVVIAGLPYSPEGPTAFIVQANNLASGVGGGMVASAANGGSTSLAIYKLVSGVLAQLTDADFTNTSVLNIGGVYFV